MFSQWRSEDTNAFAKLNNQYDGAMTVASHDAADQLRLNARPTAESGYFSYKFSRINKEPAFETFIHTLALNFEVEDENIASKEFLSHYVPVFGIMEYDGFSMNVYQKEGNEFKRIWLPKIPFTYHDPYQNVVQFTLDDYVIVYDSLLQEWIEGTRKELLKDDEISQPLHDFLADGTSFDRLRRDTIVDVLQENLSYQINAHNVYAKQLGITYKFAMPLIPQEDWYNTVDDVGVFSFFQGYPYQHGNGTFNQYAFAGTRIVKKDMYHASNVNGQKIYFAESCGFSYPVEEIYPSKKEAAKAGYYEKSCLNTP